MNAGGVDYAHSLLRLQEALNPPSICRVKFVAFYNFYSIGNALTEIINLNWRMWKFFYSNAILDLSIFSLDGLKVARFTGTLVVTTATDKKIVKLCTITTSTQTCKFYTIATLLLSNVAFLFHL